MTDIKSGVGGALGIEYVLFKLMAYELKLSFFNFNLQTMLSLKSGNIGVIAAGTCTGCTVVLCNTLSQASCQSSTNERGAGLLQEEVGAHVGITICEKSPALAALAKAVDKCQEVAALRHSVYPLQTYVRLLA